MIQRLQQKRHGEGGFTLVELLVVIVILGILASIVVFAVGGITDKGGKSACSAERSALETAEEAYFAQNGVYAAESALVPGFMRTESTRWNVTVTPAAGTTPASFTTTAVSSPVPSGGVCS